VLSLVSAPAAALQDIAPPLAPRAAEPPIVATIRVEGQRRYTVSQLQKGLGISVGDRLDYDQIERGIETLWKSFHVRAEVSMRPVQGGVELCLSVVEVDPRPGQAARADGEGHARRTGPGDRRRRSTA
jgi:outer membrane protein assembly factor BamA